MPKLRLLLQCAVLLTCGSLFTATTGHAATAPDGPSFAVRVLDTDDGLPQNSVISMVQARDGYLWLGTLNGLVRFDGERFSHLLNANNTPALRDSRIVHLFEDSQRILWIGTETAGTLMIQDGVVSAPPQLAVGGVERRLRAAAEDASGAVWLYLANGDLWRYHEGSFSGFTIDPPEESVTRTIIQERNGPLWVGTAAHQFAVGAVTENGALALPVEEKLTIGRLDHLVAGRNGGYWRLANFRVQQWVGDKMVRDIGAYPWSRRLDGGFTMFLQATCATEDREGNLVVGTDVSGVFIVTPGGEVSQISTNGTSHGTIGHDRLDLPNGDRLSDNWVKTIVVDRESTLWVGTDGGGLNRVKRQALRTPAGIPNWSVESVTVTSDGTLVMGTARDGVTFWTNGTPSASLAAGRAIRSVYATREGALWIGNRDGGLCLQTSQLSPPECGQGADLIEQPVRAIHQDRTGRMWFGTGAGVISLSGSNDWKRFTTRDGLSGNQITAIADDTVGQVWIGTERSGINRLGAEGNWTAFRSSEGAPGDDIAGIWTDAEGVVWVSTFGNGLGCYRNGRWTRFTTREGLSSNNLGYLIDDGQGHLWIGSDIGVLRVPKGPLLEVADGERKLISSRVFDKSDGLPTRGLPLGSQPRVWRDSNGTLWFATTKGVAYARPTELRTNTNPPPVSIETSLVDDAARRPATIDNQRTLELRHGDDHVEFTYSSPILSAPERARFRYQLEGYDKEWNDVGNTRVAAYRKLPPGQYTFRVAAANEDGVWNEEGASLAVIVRPPFWRTWWFITGFVLLTLAWIAGAVHYFSTQRLQRQLAAMREQEALQRERARIARDIHDQVGASLTQVALLGELVETDKEFPQEVEAHAQQICQTARETTRALDEIVWTVNPANDTLEGLTNYICKHAQDFLAVAGLRYRLEVPETLPPISITPEVRHNVFLASKEAITNIVRHAKATAAWLRLRVEPNVFVFEIEDNGRGIPDPDAPTVRNGLRNMRKRMEDIGGKFEIDRGVAGGALVRLTVPMQKANMAAKQVS